MPTAACDHRSAAAAASRRRLRVCFIVSLAVLLLLAVAVAVLAITALRPHPADTTISTIRLTSVSLSPGLSLNVTLDVVLSIRNPGPVASFAHGAALRSTTTARLARTPSCRPDASAR
uniref:Late embryogenesis abundant protein LEA-2 subgroup domain-containing protein n=1 Tax=Aegilops tauschii subsp. strangulata TaxID=200361 RepID=A0A453GJL2_AEGTS